MLVWTACAAVYLSLTQSLPQFPVASQRQLPILFTALGSLGGGAALGGLVLLVVWRRRGILFPVYPGEYLLVVLGLELLLGFALQGIGSLERFVSAQSSTPSPLIAVLAMVFTFAYVVGEFSIVLWAIRNVSISRWRVFFISMLASYFLCCGVGTLPIAAIPYGVILLPTLVLLAVVFQDRKERKEYPWSHWVGVAASLWGAAIAVASALTGSFWQ